MEFSKDELRAIYRRKVNNHELNLKEFAERRLVLNSRPAKVLVELTQNCNFKCVMCDQFWEPRFKKHNPDYDMTMPMFEKVASELFHDAHLVDLRGLGETTILPWWPEIVERLAGYPLVNWHLVTNLSLPRDETWEAMVDRGFALGFSCDAATKATFETIRVRSRFERILHNLKLVSSRMAEKKRGFLYFITVVQRANIDELPAIVELAHSHGVREVQFKKVQNSAAYVERLSIAERDRLAQSLRRSVDVALERGVRLTINDQALASAIEPERLGRAFALPGGDAHLNFPPSQEFLGEVDPEFAQDHPWHELDERVRETARVSLHKRCFKPFHYTIATYDGRIGTCNHMMMSPDILEMGDLREQSFEQIWNGEAYQFFRAGLSYRKPMDPRCEWCFAHRLDD